MKAHSKGRREEVQLERFKATVKKHKKQEGDATDIITSEKAENKHREYEKI